MLYLERQGMRTLMEGDERIESSSIEAVEEKGVGRGSMSSIETVNHLINIACSITMEHER